MTNIKVSILVPIYGVEKYIERCAVSLFEQTYDNIEYVFVNDCTQDKSMEILKEVIDRYPMRKGQIIVINHEHNLGLAGARLTALRAATGNYVWNVDSDDYVEVNALQEMLNYMEHSYDIITCSYIEEHEKERKKVKVPALTVERVCRTLVVPSIWKNLIKRSLYIDNNIYPIVGINYAEDLMVMAELVLCAPKTIACEKYLYHYNCTNIGAMTAVLSLNMYENCVDAVHSVYMYYKQSGALKRYGGEIILLLCKYFEIIYSYSKHSKKLRLLQKDIKDLNCVVGYFMKINNPYIVRHTMLRLYKFLFLGRNNKYI